MKPDNENKQIVVKTGTSGLAIALLLSLVAGGGFYYFKRKKDSDAQDAAKQLLDEPTRQASLISSNLGAWYQSPNLPAILEVARQIKDWPAVVTAYSLLYRGANIEEDVKSAFSKHGNYQDFITALSKKGLPGNNSGSVVVKPAVTATKKGDKLILDNSKFPVVYYKTWQEYPGKPLSTIPVGRLDPKKAAVTFLAKLEAAYAGSSVKANLYQIQLSAGTVVWVNGDRNIRKRAGTAGVYGMGFIQRLEVA